MNRILIAALALTVLYGLYQMQDPGYVKVAIDVPVRKIRYKFVPQPPSKTLFYMDGWKCKEPCID